MRAGRWGRPTRLSPSSRARAATHNAIDGMEGLLLGPSFSQPEVETRLNDAGAVFEVLDEPDLIAARSTQLRAGKVVGWFQGRMEFGPRALGARSILGDPRKSPPCSGPEPRRSSSARASARSRPRCCGRTWRNGSSWTTDRPYMLLVGPVAADKRRA